MVLAKPYIQQPLSPYGKKCLHTIVKNSSNNLKI